MSAEIITPMAMTVNRRIAQCYVRLRSVSELVELANSLGVKLVFRFRKEYVFVHEGTVFYAKE